MKKFTRERVVPTISASTRQSFFTGVEQVIDEICFQAAVPREHVRNEAV